MSNSPASIDNATKLITKAENLGLETKRRSRRFNNEGVDEWNADSGNDSNDFEGFIMNLGCEELV